MTHEIHREGIHVKLMPHESLFPWFHGPWNTRWWDSWKIHAPWKSLPMVSWPMKYSVTSFHGKFKAHECLFMWNSWVIKWTATFSLKIHGHKFSHEILFCSFQGHGMPFMGYSLEIHGIFTKMFFIVLHLQIYSAKPGLRGLYLFRHAGQCPELNTFTNN